MAEEELMLKLSQPEVVYQTTDWPSITYSTKQLVWCLPTLTQWWHSFITQVLPDLADAVFELQQQGQ